ncbi:hypothetical protein ACVMFA_002355 [Bradyrhizobium liaoningense]
MRIRRVLQCISRLLGSLQQSWPQEGRKFLSEKIAGIDMLPH